MKSAAILLLLIPAVLPLSASEQTPLAKAFEDIKSSDPNTAKAARRDLALIAEKEMPTIEKDIGTLCKALRDPDPYVRLQSAGILVSVVIAAPIHNQVVTECFPDLIYAASLNADEEVQGDALRARNDALFALSVNPAGPPADAHEIFVRALKSDNFRTAEVGAAGLIREDGGRDTASQALIANALGAARDSKHRINLLYAISGAAVKSDTLFHASEPFLSDPNPDIQEEAIKAMVATAPDKSMLNSAMQRVETLPAASMITKKHAKAILAGPPVGQPK